MTTAHSKASSLKRFPIRPVPVTLICLLIIGLIWFAVTTEKRRIRSVIKSMESAVENEDTGSCIGWLASDYLDAYGYRVSDVRDVLNDVFESLDDITVTILNTDIDVSDDAADVTIDFRMVATVETGMRGYILGNPRNPARIIVRMNKSHRWRIQRVETIKVLY